jgi:transposase
MTCNSCEENEPGVMWIEFYSIDDVEKFLAVLIKTLGERIHRSPEANDWFCYRMLGLGGEKLSVWRYDAFPNIQPSRANQRNIYSKKISNYSVEFSVSIRFPREDYAKILDLLNKYLMNDKQFEDLSDDQWNYVKRYLPPQPYKGRKRSDDRQALNGMLYLMQTGCCGRELPQKYGSYATVKRRMNQWSNGGILDRVLSNIAQDVSRNNKPARYSNTVDFGEKASTGRRCAKYTENAGEEKVSELASHDL